MSPVATKAPSLGAYTPVVRHFTTPGQSPLDAIEWSKRRSELKDKRTGEMLFEMDDVEVPADWSQLSTDILVNKYFRKGGVPIGDGTGSETSARQVVGRLTQAIDLAAKRLGAYFPDAQTRRTLHEELTHLLLNRMVAFNSPAWFNLGLAEAYGIKGNPAGNWCWDQASPDDTVKLCEDGYSRPQVSACFIRKVEDDLMSIGEGIVTEMRLFKYGSGTGTNFSNLRAEGERLSGGGRSSGVMSFLEVYDRAAGSIKSGGVTRRAAKMNVLDIDHPDIIKFIEWKVREEAKAAALVKMGYDADFEGEAFRTISGQNANNSVRVTDAFLRAVERRGEFNTRWRKDGSIAHTYEASVMMQKIGEAAWSCADPGIQFHDTCNEWNTVPNTGPIRATNPCGEFNFLDDTACNLASINLLKFLKKDGTFNVAGFAHTCRVTITAQEILVDHASYPTEAIARNSHRLRPLGLGYANLGALLLQLGLPYDSDEGRAWAAALTALMCGVAWETSASIAAAKGPFKEFAHNRDAMLGVGRRHAAKLADVDRHLAPENVIQAATAAWRNAIALGEAHGFRNAQLTLLAPTGTIGMLMHCDTTGIEPVYMHVMYKTLAGGGMMKLANDSIAPALKRLGYDESTIEGITDFVVEHDTIEGAPGLKDAHLDIFDCAVPGQGVRFIEPMGHVKMMAAVQPFLCGSISKTVNMPESVSVKDVIDVYMDSWRLGLKCIALYRDNSKGCQVLNAKAQLEAPSASRPPAVRIRLPKKRPGTTQEVTVGGHKVYLRTGEYKDGTLGEIFINLHNTGAPLRAWADCFAILTSIALQHGVPLKELVDAFTFTRFEPHGPVSGHDHVKQATSIVDYIFRSLGIEYLDRLDLAHVHPLKDVDEHAPTPVNGNGNGNGAHLLVKQTASRDATTCARCNGLTRRSGTCNVCTCCGDTTGCS